MAELSGAVAGIRGLRSEDPIATGEFSAFLNISSKNYSQLSTPTLEGPAEVDSFSRDGKGSYIHGRSMLRRFNPPESAHVCFDLNIGYATFINRHRAQDENLHKLLRCVSNNEDLLNMQPDFICRRGLLTKVMCTPYLKKEKWTVVAGSLAGAVYMCELEEEDSYPDRDKMTYWGLKLKQYVTTKTAGSSPDTAEPVNSNEAFYSVVFTKIGKHKLLYCGEVDCTRGDSSNPLSGYVELKTSFDFASDPRKEKNFLNFKLIKWWAQSYILGVPEVVCGFRNDEGMVHRTKQYDTAEMPGLAKGQWNRWDPAICMKWLDDFLKFVKEVVSSDEQHVYVFEHAADGVAVKVRRHASDEASAALLPPWYKEYVRNRPSS